MNSEILDAVIVGGGFYGAVIAIYLRRQRRFRRVILIEREPGLLLRASYNNQARVHAGYHYPRSLTTALRSRVNAPRFLRDWPEAVKRDFVKVYAIARRNSKVTAKQFLRFCQEVGAKIRPADAGIVQMFEPRLIEEVFVAEEYAFDAERLAQWIEKELRGSGVETHLSARVIAIGRAPENDLVVTIQAQSGQTESLHCRYLFNCTYSGLNQFSGDFRSTRTGLKHELTEMALMEVPGVLNDVGVTVMDGSFFSMMPFPPRGLHTLSHVRYTPHFSWEDESGVDPYEMLARYDRASRVDRMIRDAARYLPIARQATYVESLFEVKTVLAKNEVDDGRPILFERHEELPGCYSILGGKIDNVYDVIERLDKEEFIGAGR